MKIIRVFPRITNATPDDENTRYGEPSFFDDADAVEISVSFTWDIPKAEYLAKQWERIAPVRLGGPAYNDIGGEFEPGKYLKKGYVITSRGCPNHCFFCMVPKREGGIRELEIKDGWNVLDSNLLACSDQHIKNVFSMLKRQNKRPRFTGGLEAKLLLPWIAESIKDLNPETIYFAYDTPDDWEPLVNAANLLKQYNALDQHTVFCYVLIGYKGDTIVKAEKRLIDVINLGITPMAMLYNLGEKVEDKKTWKRFQREYANKFILFNKIKAIKQEEI